MRRRLKRRVARSQQRRRNFRERIKRFVRALFGRRGRDEWGDAEGGVDVREPRRPLQPSLSGAVAVETPSDETRDVWTVGRDHSE